MASGIEAGLVGQDCGESKCCSAQATAVLHVAPAKAWMLMAFLGYTQDPLCTCLIYRSGKRIVATHVEHQTGKLPVQGALKARWVSAT